MTRGVGKHTTTAAEAAAGTLAAADAVLAAVEADAARAWLDAEFRRIWAQIEAEAAYYQMVWRDPDIGAHQAALTVLCDRVYPRPMASLVDPPSDQPQLDCAQWPVPLLEHDLDELDREAREVVW